EAVAPNRFVFDSAGNLPRHSRIDHALFATNGELTLALGRQCLTTVCGCNSTSDNIIKLPLAVKTSTPAKTVWWEQSLLSTKKLGIFMVLDGAEERQNRRMAFPGRPVDKRKAISLSPPRTTRTNR